MKLFHSRHMCQICPFGSDMIKSLAAMIHLKRQLEALNHTQIQIHENNYNTSSAISPHVINALDSSLANSCSFWYCNPGLSDLTQPTGDGTFGIGCLQVVEMPVLHTKISIYLQQLGRVLYSYLLVQENIRKACKVHTILL